MPAQETRAHTTLGTGLVTDRMPDASPPALRVTWIAWDSPFRSTGLRVGDRIVALDGDRIEDLLPSTPTGLFPGEYNEATGWERTGALEGQEVRLEVLRDATIGTVQAHLAPDAIYADPAGRRALAPGGPMALERDGFSASWDRWYEEFVKRASAVLDRGWKRGSFDNQRELRAHDEHAPRVRALEERHPGPFADAVREDFDRVRARLAGRPVELDPEDLAYRELGAKRVEQVRAAADAAWAVLAAELAEETMPAFPAPDPDRREQVVGQVVELPWLSQWNLVNDLGRSFAVAGSRREGFWFVDFQAPSMQHFFDAWFRFRGDVNPELRDRWRFLGRVQDVPRMLTVDGRPEAGLVLQVLGVAAGQGEMVADLRTPEADGTVRYAGEAEIAGRRRDPPGPEAGPTEVVEAMIDAIKRGDRGTWQALFADWRLFSRWGGEPLVDTAWIPGAGSFVRPWEESRRRILDDVWDVRVAEVEPPRVRVVGSGDGLVPRVEEVVVWVDHVGRFDDGFRTFSKVGFQRRWTLQRLDDGPWRIDEPRRI